MTQNDHLVTSLLCALAAFCLQYALFWAPSKSEKNVAAWAVFVMALILAAACYFVLNI